MPELTITLEPKTEDGSLEIRIALSSDDDCPAHEHEADHRRWVRRLLPTLVMTDEEESNIRTQREKPACEPVLG